MGSRSNSPTKKKRRTQRQSSEESGSESDKAQRKIKKTAKKPRESSKKRSTDNKKEKKRSRCDSSSSDEGQSNSCHKIQKTGNKSREAESTKLDKHKQADTQSMRASKKSSHDSRYDSNRQQGKHGNPSNERRQRDVDSYHRGYYEESSSKDTYWNVKAREPSPENHIVGGRYYGDSKKESDRNHRPKKDEQVNAKPEQETKKAPKKNLDPISSKTGGAYIPPAMLKLMQASITDKSSTEFQRISWEALKKSIHGLINKVNRTNIDKIIIQLLRENIVRGRGLLCRSLIQAQALSPTFTHVYAALAALINSRFPNVGELLLKRLVIQFRRGFKRNDKLICISAATFVAHLVNQRVAHEILALEILTVLVETPTDDSIEVAIAFLKECGMKLTEVSKKGIDAIFEMLRHVLNENKVERRVQYMIDVMFQVRKDKFKDNEAISDGLDLVEEEDQFTHLITLDDVTDGQDILNVFKTDPDYVAHEEKYQELCKEMVGDSEISDSGEEDGDDDDDDEEGSGDNEDQPQPEKQVIIDNTETNLVALRRTIYLTINSSLDFEECCHKLMKMQLKPGQETEVCAMVLDCCCEMRTYERFFGLLAQRLCQVNRMFIGPCENLFRETYATVHRLKKGQCRNVAKLLAHLLFTDAISWDVLSCIRLNEQDTTSSGRIFIKILFLELTEYMGLTKLYERVKDEDQLREHLKTAVQIAVTTAPVGAPVPVTSSSSSSDDSTDSSDSSSSDSSDESSEEEKRKRSKNKNKKSKTKKKKSPITKKKKSKSKSRK